VIVTLPLDVHIYVTPRCNLSCPHCYYDALGRGRQPTDLLELPEIARVLTELGARFDADISLEGGEPFMRAGLGAMLATLDETVLSRITITTNGTVRLAAPAAVLRQLGGLRVSIDGHTDDLQQELRGVDVAPVLATCVKLRKMQVSYTVRMTLFKRNIRRLTEIYDWAQTNEIAQLSLFEYQSSGRGIGQDLLFGVSDADVDQLLQDIVSTPRPDALQLVTVNLAERRVDTVLERQDALTAAGVSVHSLPETANCTINYNGTVGVSPWMVTAHGSPDAFAVTSSPDFFDQLEKAAADGALRDDSACLSRVQLRCER
jgi:MoaA/NifB/PqqE/SkfB family radical SAM enzyme